MNRKFYYRNLPLFWAIRDSRSPALTKIKNKNKNKSKNKNKNKNRNKVNNENNINNIT